MTVEQLAQQLGISIKEALALCTVAGVKVRDGTSRLSAADQESVRKVLSGEKKLIDPTRPGGTGYVKKRAGKEAVIAGSIIGVILLFVVAIGLGARVFGGGGEINVEAGECFDAVLFGTTVFGSEINPTPCDEAAYRAFAVLRLDEVFPTWPGREAIEGRARERCTAIAGQGGVTELVIYYFGPGDETAWAEPAGRKIVCATTT